MFYTIDAFTENEQYYSRQSWDDHSTAYRGFLVSVPIIAYLLEILVQSIYSLLVFYFGFVHRRHAFLPTQMLVLALLSFASAVLPDIIFCLNVWVDYFVGCGYWIHLTSLVASVVVVWEWIDRVQTSERDEGNDGVLGNQIYDEEDHSAKTKNEKTWSSSSQVSFYSLATRIPTTIFHAGRRTSIAFAESIRSIRSSIFGNHRTPSPNDFESQRDVDTSSHYSHPLSRSESSAAAENERGMESLVRTSTISQDRSTSPIPRKHLYPLARSTHISTSTISPLSPQFTIRSLTHPTHFNLLDSEVSRPAPFSEVDVQGEASSSEAGQPSSSGESDAVLPGFQQGDYYHDPEDLADTKRPVMAIPQDPMSSIR